MADVAKVVTIIGSSPESFAQAAQAAVVAADPEGLTVEFRRAKRGDRIFVDVNRNAYGQHAVAPYAVRARPGAPVATPLRWEEVNASLDPSAFTMDVVLDRVAKEGDLFAGVLTGKQSLGDALRSLR